MRKLASVVRVSELVPIAGADKICVAKMNNKGWQCVVRKDGISVGDLGVYFEIDSLLPLRPEFEFLGNRYIKTLEDGTKGYRIQTIKLRNQLSQGLLLPITDFFTEHNYKEGDDLTDVLNVRLWSQPIPACLSGKIKGKFPYFIPKTDQERIQNLPEILNNFDSSDWEISVKMDGSSCTMYYASSDWTYEPSDKDTFGVCSRNLDLCYTSENAFWDMVEKYNMKERMKAMGVNYAIQGELCGPGIQKNRQQLADRTLFIYDIYDIAEARYLLPHERVSLCKKYFDDVPHVPIIENSRLVNPTLDELLAFAEGEISKGVQREGIVFKKRSGGGHRSFKVISNKYLLHHKI